jgi:thioesterase domain-containing protein
MARRLTAQGETVGLLAVLDSGGPLWRPRPLTDGTPCDEFMFNAARRARPELDPFSPSDGVELLQWLAEPAGDDAPSITRYLHEVYRLRDDLRDAFPRLDGPDAEAFVLWSWVEGYARLGLCAKLLPRLPASSPPVQPIRKTLRNRAGLARDRIVWRMDEAAELLTAGRRAGATGRQRQRVLEAHHRALLAYRAGCYDGIVTLMRSHEYRVNTHLDRWYALDTAGVVEVEIDGNHRSMMREPDAASLADRLSQLIDDAAR